MTSSTPDWFWAWFQCQELTDISEVLRIAEKSFSERKIAEETTHKELIERLTREQGETTDTNMEALYGQAINQFENQHPDDMANYADEYPQLMRRMAFMGMWSVLEERLRSFCRSQESEDKLRLKDINASGLSGFQKFLEKVVCLSFSKTAPWESLSHYATLRNYLIHAGPLLMDKQNISRAKNAIDNLDHVELKDVSSAKEIILGEEFIVTLEHLARQLVAMIGNASGLCPSIKLFEL